MDIVNYWISKQTQTTSKGLAEKLANDTGLPVYDGNFRGWANGNKPLPHRMYKAMIKLVVPHIAEDVREHTESFYAINADWLTEILLPIEKDYRKKK